MVVSQKGMSFQLSLFRYIRFQGCGSHGSKKTPTDPWNIRQTLNYLSNYLFTKEILSYLYFGVPGVPRGLLEFSLNGRFYFRVTSNFVVC